MLNKEHVQKDTITTHIHHAEVKRQGDENWEMIAKKSTKKRPEGNMKPKDNELVITKEVILTANRFAALATNSNTTSNEYGMKPACGNLTKLPSATDSDQEREVKNVELGCSNIVDLHKGLHVNSKARLNLKNHSATRQHSYTKEEEARFIPTIINGQITNKETSRNIKQTPSHHQKLKQKTTKTSVSSTGRRNKILIISDSHVRGISERIRNYLNVPFNVTGITKPNANTESITSPSHFEAENLTKQDLLIFHGGTKDISHN